MSEIEAEGYGAAILRTLRELRDAGVHRASALIRHSAREFDPDRRDLENQLTDEGRGLAQKFGEALPRDVFLRAYASPIERCMETAALSLDAHRSMGGSASRHRELEGLGPFYILDQRKMFRIIESAQEDGRDFMREWFDAALDPDTVIAPRQCAEIMLRLVLEKLRRQATREGPTLDLCVTHDVNVHLIKDQVLGLKHEVHGQVEFLDGVVIFEREGTVWMQAPRTAAIPLDPFLEASR